MKVNFYIDEDTKVVLEVYEGELEMNQILEASRRFWNLPEFNPHYDVLIDMRTVKKGLKLDETLRLSNTISDLEDGFRSKIAILVTDPRIAAQAELYGEGAKTKQAVQVFVSPNEAIEYVGGPRDIFEREYESAMEVDFDQPSSV